MAIGKASLARQRGQAAMKRWGPIHLLSTARVVSHPFKVWKGREMEGKGREMEGKVWRTLRIVQ
jgi:protein gp37